jgi:hypothetical protein
LVTNLETDWRLTLSNTDTDVARRTVVKEWILEALTVTDVKHTHYTSFLCTNLACISIFLTEPSCS